MPIIQCPVTQGGGGLVAPNLTTVFYNNADPIAFDSPPRFYTFRADLSSLPSGATINAVTLKMYSEVAFSGQVITIYQCLKPWVAGEVSGTNYSTGNPWETTGGEGPTDRTASVGTITALSSDDGVQLSSTAISTSIVADWASGAVVNNGFSVYAPTGTFVDWSGASDATNPPVLEIDYTASGGTVYTLEAGVLNQTFSLSSAVFSENEPGVSEGGAGKMGIKMSMGVA